MTLILNKDLIQLVRWILIVSKNTQLLLKSLHLILHLMYVMSICEWVTAQQ
jgi:hypothetical protein